MNRSIKSVLALVVLLSLCACGMGWALGDIGGFPGSRYWLRASGLVALLVLVILLRAEFRRDLVPDFLAKRVKSYFEQSGLCFSILPSVQDAQFAWQILFQNRFERPCKAIVAFRPAVPGFGFRRPTLDEVKAEIDCDGGAFGCASITYAIDQKYQGKRVSFELTAVTNFEGGKGKMLRFRDGLAVGKRRKSAVDLTITALSVLALHPHWTSSARFKVRLPTGVSSESCGEITQKILWRPGDPVA